MKINDKKSLSVYPLIENIEYSEPISSEKLNKQFQSLKESVLRSLIRTQEINTSLNIFEQAVVAQGTALGNQYNSLLYKDNTNSYITAYDDIMVDENNINHDTAYGYITLNTVAHYSKIPRLEKYNGKVSPQVKIFINYQEQEIDSGPYYTLDNSLNTVWFDTFAPDSEVRFEIQLPPSLTKRFNYIRLDPFPIFGFNITKITYQDLYGNYHDINEDIYGTHDPLLNNKAYPTKIFTSPKEFNGTLIIYGKTDSTGYFGFSNIDIGFMDFDNTTTEVFVEYNIYEKDNSTTRSLKLETCVLDYYFDAKDAKSLLNNTNPVLEARLISGTKQCVNNSCTIVPGAVDIKLDISANQIIDINKTIILSPNQRLYLKLRIKEHNMTTPVFRGSKLKYEKV